MATVSDLIARPFCDRPLEEQVKIVVGGRPRENIRARLIHSRNCERIHVNQSTYDEETWLCGCSERDGFFCWTCVLFVSQKSQWNIAGFYSFKKLREEMKIHKYSTNHINGMLRYQIFLKENVLSPPVEIVGRNSYMKRRHQEALKRIIDIVCNMTSEIPPCAVETVVSELPTHCVEMLNLLKLYDDPDVIEEAINIVKTNPNILTDIIVLIANIMKKEIVKELKFSTFVSVMLSVHSNVKQQKKYSIVVRYMKDGEVYERLVGFSLRDERSIDVVVTQLVTELEISDKFLALSFDGLVLPLKLLFDFMYWLSYRHPNTFFAPWYLHEFHSVLLQSMAVQPMSDVFLRTLKSMKEYFEGSPANCKAFYNSCFNQVFDLSHQKMTDSQFLRVLKMYRSYFLQYFSSIPLPHDSDWHGSDFVFTAGGYARKIQDSYIVFMLELFFQLFQYTAYVNEMLTSNSPDCVFDSVAASGILDIFRKQKEGGFDRIFYLFKAEMTRSNPEKMQNIVTNAEMKKCLMGIFQETISSLMKTVQLRYRHLKKLNFLGIFDCENLEKFDMTRNYFKNLLDSRIPFVSYNHLCSELKILTKYGWFLGRKSVFEMLELFRQKKLNETFKSSYKLAELIVTLPCKPIHPENPVTKLDCITAWVSCSFTHQAECFSLLHIENDFLKYLKSRNKFYDQVTLELDALRNLIGKNGKTNSKINH